MNLQDAEALIEQSADHRLLRRVPPPSEWRLSSPTEETRRAIFIDTETTGLGEKDEVIELALVPFEYERDSGRIVSIDQRQMLSALRQPSFPIPRESTAIHGLRDADVAGKTIDAEVVTALVEPAHLVIAHNAAFDRPMAEKHWPIFENKHWGCSLADIDWKREGLGSAKLDYLLLKQGWFYQEHRAISDALASVFLLSLPLPRSNQPTLASLLQSARRPLFGVRAEDTSFQQRSSLRQRGYRWDEGDATRPKAWWILTDNPDREVAWLQMEIYGATRKIPVVSVPPTRRYSGRVWST
jgi:DNA polymerase-3 subunit epsilon